MSNYSEVERKLAEVDVVETVDSWETGAGDYRLRVQTRTLSIPTAAMRILADAGLSIKPEGSGRLMAQPEQEGMQFSFPPEIWGTIVEQYRALDALLDSPKELALTAEGLVDEGMAEDVSDAIGDMEEARDLWAIFVERMEEETRDALAEMALDDSEDLGDYEEEVSITTVPGTSSMVIKGIDLSDGGAADGGDGEDATESVELPSQDTKQRMVFNTLAAQGPLTTTEAVEETGYKNAGTQLSVMKGRGLVEVVDTKPSGSGKRKNVWGLSDAAKEAAGALVE